MKKFVFSIAILLCSSGSSHSQTSLLGRFLAAAKNDSVVIAQKETVSRLKKIPFSLPFISDVEMRVRNRGFDVEGQRYSLKIEPRGFGETKAARDLWRAQTSFEEYSNYGELNEKIMLLYIYFVDMLERKSLANGYHDLIPVFEDRIDVMEKLQNSTDFDLTDLVKTEKDYAKLISEKIEEEQETITANRYIWSILGDTLSGGIDTVGLISVAEIKKELEKTKPVLDEKNVYLKSMKSEFEYSEKRFRLEKTQARKIISFVEFSYDRGSYLEEYARDRSNTKSFDYNKAYIIELGIKFPMISSQKEDIARREIEFLNDKEEYARLKQELVAKVIKDREDIIAYIERYELLTRRETEADAEASLKKYLEMSGIDPLVLLEIQEDLIKNRMEKEKIYFSILRNYIYVMDVNGKLIETPMRNLLSAKQEILP
jgi:hypothetical protein